METRIILLFLFSSFITEINIAQIGIGTSSPHESSIVDIDSDSKGFLPPRLTEAQRDLISSPAEGLVIYCTDCCTDGRISFYTTEWVTVPECGAPVAPNVINLPSGNFDSGGNGGFAQHPADVSYPTLFNGDSINDDNRFHEGDYIDITFSSPGNEVLLPAGSQVRVHWYHNGDNRSWGVYTTFYNDATELNTENDGPYSNVEQESVLIANPSGEFNKIRVGAISTGVGGYDARLREIDIIKPDGSEITVNVI